MSALHWLGRAQAVPVPLHLPLFLSPVSAGFPSPAQDHIERTLDLNELCIQHPAATFFLRVEGDSMIDAGIFPNDIVVVDRSLTAKHGDVVIAALDGEFTIKELQLKPSPMLLPQNARYQAIPIHDTSELEVFGVVTSVVRSLQR